MTLDLLKALIYITAYVSWMSVFRSRVDPLLREHIGSRLGIEVVWVPTVSFPVRAWTWGLSQATNERLDARLAFLSAMTCICAGSLPTVVLCVFSRWTVWLSPALMQALYLASTPMLLVFLASQMRRPTS